MISIYDLYDLSAVFKNIRARPNYEQNSIVLEKIIPLFQKKLRNTDLNQIRRAISAIPNIDATFYRFAFVENFYTHFPSLLKNHNTYFVLFQCIKSLLEVVKNESEQKIIALADCLHNLPIYIADNHGKIPKNFWKREVKSYRKMWDKNFLRNRKEKTDYNHFKSKNNTF